MDTTFNNKHILVVDDDEMILSLITRSLCDEGFQVTTVNDSTQALFMLTSVLDNNAEVDLLITDFNMPKLTGLALIDELKNQGIELPSLLISGNHEETMISEAQSRDCIGFLKKPFRVTVLIDLIHKFFEGEVESEDLQDCGS